MLLSINWLRDYITTDIPLNDLADRLTMAGIEVEEVIHYGQQWDNIAVGEIVEISPHPNADKLSLTKVSAGEKSYSVVCGAPNLHKGLKVPLALEGAVLENSIKIKRSKIRGELSDGMICSETELGLGDDSSGIMVLPDDAKPGMSLAESLGLSDTVFDLGITPNRSDCLSIIGLAREIAAIFNIREVIPDITVPETGSPVANEISVEINAPELCPRYAARVVSDVSIGPSPLWMRRRLETCGVRSINNIVDITNYVLLEWGQPLHAFDISMIKGNKIIVRRAAKGEKFVTLDEVERQLSEDTLLICNTEIPVAIGGIMGGLDSGVSPKTTGVLLESAFFTPSSISRSSSALELKTEASLRFEKGVDINGVIPALNKAAMLISQLSGGRILKGFIDKYPGPLNDNKPIMLSVKKTGKTTGLEIKAEEIKKILKRLNIHVSADNPETIQATPPSFRYDLCSDIDLIEEVCRIKGYDQIPVKYPKVTMSSCSRNKSFYLTSLIRDIFVAQGFYEVINYSFIAPELLRFLNLHKTDLRRNPVRILNPLSSAQSVLRTTLLPSLLMNLKENLNNKCKSEKIFEISNTFLLQPESNLPAESKRIAGLVSGYRYEEIWNQQQHKIDFYDIKGSVETLMDQLHIESCYCLKNIEEPYFTPKKMLALYINDSVAGVMGEVHPDVLEKFEIETSVSVFDLDFDLISMHYSDTVSFRPFSKYPAIFRDIALIVDKEIPSEKVLETIRSFKHKLINDINLFDYYHGDKIAPGKKSLAYRIKFQSFERTLTDNEVNKIHDNMLSYLSREIGAELRN